MNELVQSYIDDHPTKENKPTAFPAANSTSAFQISAGYMHVIVAIYAIIVVLVIFIIIIIIIQSIRKTWVKTDMFGYGAIPRQRVNDIAPDVESLDVNSRTYGQLQDDDSEFDNISLNIDGEGHGHNEADIPPLYENLPSYLEVGDHSNSEAGIPRLGGDSPSGNGKGEYDEHETDIPPLYENPPSYLSINR